MKKQLLILAFTFFLFNTNLLAHSDTSHYWSAVRRVAHGTTNEVKGIAADPKGNIFYSGYGYDIGSGKMRALIVGKLDDSLGITWQKNFSGITDVREPHVVLADDSSVYIFGHITTYLYFPNDSFTVKYSNNPESFFLCLNAQNGEVRWVKHFVYKYGVKLAFDGNNDLVLGINAYNGIQVYDNQRIDSIFVKSYQTGYGYLTIDKSNGNLKNHAFGTNKVLDLVNGNTIDGRNVVSLSPIVYGGFYTYIELTPKVLNLDNNTISSSANKIKISSNDGYFEVLNTLYHPKDKSWTLFLNHGVGASTHKDLYVGNDTLKLPMINNVFEYGSVVKLDSSLKITKYITHSNLIVNKFQQTSDTNLLFAFGVEGDGYVINNGKIDTIIFKGAISSYHKGYIVARCNQNFENFVYTRFSVMPDNLGWQTGMELKGLILKPNGSFYSAAFHENDIYALPVIVRAYNKSWKHLSIIAKYGNSSPEIVSSNHPKLKENSNLIYPNPTNGIINIENATTVQSINVYNLSGQLVKTFSDVDFTQEINLQDLTNGVYLLQIVGDNGINTVKVLKE